ncbi:MAG: hypothetical protein J0L79_03325 [Rickettsiales bacterium]|nr:hypothetical protein [Rickettsiales bacterium]
MEKVITRKDISEEINEISDKVDSLMKILSVSQQRIKELETENTELKKSNHDTLSQIKEYIGELEQIRNHYVDSHNNNKR